MAKKKMNWRKLANKEGFVNEVEMLRELYLDKKTHPGLIALRLDCSVSTVWSKLRELNLKRVREEASKNWGMRGF